MTSTDDVRGVLLQKNKKEVKEKSGILTNTTSLFYYCALISAWDDRSWYFLVGIYLVALDPSSLILTAVFGLLSSGLVLLLGSVVGSWVDRTSRLKASYIVLIVRNISTLICSLVLCLVFFYYDKVVTSGDHPTLFLLSKIGLIVFGVTAHLGGMTNNSMLSKDWIAILCDGDSHRLSNMTSRFRLIDLMSKVLAPVIIGQIMTFTSKAVASIVFSIQVLLTLLLFCFLLKVIYHRMPRLHYREDIIKLDTSPYQKIPSEEELQSHSHSVVYQNNRRRRPPTCTTSKDDLPEEEMKASPSVFSDQFSSLIEGWKVYFSHQIKFAGLGLALLYMTVLGFDTVTIGYALSQGMTEFILSLFNAGAAITGIIGAVLFPHVLNCTNVVYTGILAIFLQLLGLTPCIVSVFVPPFNNSIYSKVGPVFSNNTGLVMSTPPIYNAGSLSIYLLMGGIVASRVGLWMFDLSVSQLLIETVYEADRGKMNGVQNSLNMLFDMIKFGLVLWLPYPYQFGFLVLASVGAVAAGNILYMVFAVVNKCKITTHL